MEYRGRRDLSPENVQAPCRATEWSSAKKPDKLLTALLASHALVTAWDGTKLAGHRNVISYGQWVVHYTHLLGLAEYQRRGFGSRLVLMLMGTTTEFTNICAWWSGGALSFTANAVSNMAAKVSPCLLMQPLITEALK